MIKIKNIIRYEQLTGKSFSDFDNSDEDDVMALLYCIELPNGSFEQFKNASKIAKKALSESLKNINECMELINQFSETKKEDSLENEKENDTKSHEKVSIIAASLIFGGVDAHFVMEELEIQDLPLFVKGLENKNKAKMENDRLWTFYNILPHVGKGISKPQDLMVFPWEADTEKAEALKNIEDNAKKFEDFMKFGKGLKNDLIKN